MADSSHIYSSDESSSSNWRGVPAESGQVNSLWPAPIIQPELHDTKRGETIPQLARGQIGPSASADELKNYIAKTYAVNHLKPNSKLKQDSQIMLPGRTADGGLVLIQPSGDTETFYPGHVLVDNSDKSTILITHTANANELFEHHTGPKIEDNFNDIGYESKAQHVFTPAGENRPLEYMKDGDVARERNHLDKLAADTIRGRHALETFRFNMAVLEDRAKDWGITDELVIDTYKRVAKLLEPQSNALLNDSTRTHLAQQIISFAARSRTDQGNHNTCAEASLQNRTFAMYPADAARLITDIASTGTYVSAEGVRVNLMPVPHDQSKENPTPDNHRDFASEIFQVVAVNIHFAIKNKANQAKKGKLEDSTVYEQREPTGGSDTGERLVETKTDSQGVKTSQELLLHEPGLTDDDLVNVSWSITGKHEDMVVLAHTDPYWDKNGTTKLVKTFSNEVELANDLRQLNAGHKKSVAILRVDAMDEPFWQEFGCSPEKKTIAPHSIAVQVGDDNRIITDNHWGQANRHDLNAPLAVHQLYELSLRANSPELVDALKSDVLSNEALGKATAATRTAMAMDILRHEQEAQLLPAGTFTDSLEQIIDANFVTNAGTKPFDETSRGIYGCIVKNVSAAERLELKSHENKIGMLTDSDFDQLFVNEQIAISERQLFSLPDLGTSSDNDRTKTMMAAILHSLPPERQQKIETELAARQPLWLMPKSPPSLSPSTSPFQLKPLHQFMLPSLQQLPIFLPKSIAPQ